jgi:hypothetical protein
MSADMTMPDAKLTYVVTQLTERRGSWARVAELSGVPYRTVRKIGAGETRDPRSSTVNKLFSYFMQSGITDANGQGVRLR